MNIETNRRFNRIADLQRFDQWLKYRGRGLYSGPYEIIPATLYDTLVYTSGVTYRLDFFNNIRATYEESNMMMPGLLPSPCSFMIDSIAIEGITSKLRTGYSRLVLGHKHYGSNPAWTYGLKSRGMCIYPKIIIPPLMPFRFEISWNEGKDLTPIMNHPLEVVLFGMMARPIQ